jgi:hypothetical protein
VTYVIPPDSPKAVKAQAFGREMVKAMRARDIPLKEVARAAGIGRTALDHYRTGSVMPKSATALAIAEVLDWPKLARIVDEARTFVCSRPGCGRTYRHEGGGPRRYCTQACVRLATAQRRASTQLRRAGQTDDGRHRAAAIAQLRSAARIADERAAMAESAIASYCQECEPEGLCRQEECPLRAFSPLPLATREGDGRPRTLTEVRAEAARKAAPGRSATMTRRWSDPDWRAKQTALTGAGVARMTPEQLQERGRRISAAKKGKPGVPWSDERRAAHRAGVRAAQERRRAEVVS